MNRSAESHINIELNSLVPVNVDELFQSVILLGNLCGTQTDNAFSIRFQIFINSYLGLLQLLILTTNYYFGFCYLAQCIK